MGLPRESWFSRHRISVEECYRMGEAEILPPDARVELIDGEVIDMAAIGPSHAAVTNDLLSVLLSAVNGKGLVRGQAPIHLNDQSEPQPDVVIVRLRPGNYRDAHPGPSDILLLIEVSDTTLRFDREVKVPLYAQAGVPEVWIVDLNGRKVQYFRRPNAGRYTDTGDLDIGRSVPLQGVIDATIDLAELIRPAATPPR